MIHPEGAPPFMLLGYEGEAKLVKSWEDKAVLEFFETSGRNLLAAEAAAGVRQLGPEAPGAADAAVLDGGSDHSFRELESGYGRANEVRVRGSG